MRLDAWTGALRVTPMILDAARTIANMGKCPRLHDCYDATADAEDHQELVTPSVCPDSFWRARHDQDLVGSLTEDRTEEDRACEIGFGLRPDLTGGCRGATFLTAVLQQLRRSQDSARIVLSVAAFNSE
ncbi:hypothetical protein GCM10028787_00190 [Brachybacterium horti]